LADWLPYGQRVKLETVNMFGSVSATAVILLLFQQTALLKCASCGEYMIGTVRSSHGREYTTYYCPTHKNDGNKCPTKEINTICLDKMVSGVLIRDLYTRKDHNKINQVLAYNEMEKKLMDKKRGVEKAITNVMKNMEYVTSELLAAKLEALCEEKAVIEEKLSKCVTVVTLSKNNIKDVCKKFIRYLIDSDDLEVKLFLKEAICEVLVSNEDVQIKLNVA